MMNLHEIRRLLATFLIILLQISSFCQNSIWVNFSSGKHITCLADEGGFVWAGTMNGLVRSEKSTGNITWFDKCNSPLPSNSIVSIAIDRQGTKWISVGGYGLMKFDNTNWTFYDTAYCGVSLHSISVVRIDTAGNRWLGTNAGLVRFSVNNTWSVFNTNNSGISGNIVKALWIDEQDTKWIGTSEGVSRFSGNSWITYTTANSGLPSSANDITVDDNGIKWFATCEGLARFNDVSWTVYNSSNSALTTDYITCVCHDSSGNIWVGGPLFCKSYAGGGLFKFDQQNWTYYSATNSGLPCDNIQALIADSSGMIWIGTYFGMTSFNGTTWTPYTTGNSGLTDDRITCFAMTPDGRQWVGCGSNGYNGYFSPGITVYDGYSWVTFNSANSGVNGDVRDIETDFSGKVYISQRSFFSPGILCYDGTSWIALYDSVMYFPSFYSVLARDSSGIIWVGSNGLGKLNGNNWIVFNRSNSQMPAEVITSIACGKNGVIWFAGWDSIGAPIGLVKFDGTNWTVYDTSNSPIPDNRVLSIAIDHSGNVWIGTPSAVSEFDGINWTTSSHVFNDIRKVYVDNNDVKWIGDWLGLHRMDDSSFVSYNAANSGLPENDVRDILMDEEGNLWCGTVVTGIGVFNPNGVCLKTNSFLSRKAPGLRNYPNPFSQSTTIRVPEPFVKEHLLLELSGLSGKIVLREKHYNQNEIRISGDHLSGGIWFFRLISEKGIVIGQGKMIVND